MTNKAQEDAKTKSDVPIIEENYENKDKIIESVVQNVLWQSIQIINFKKCKFITINIKF